MTTFGLSLGVPSTDHDTDMLSDAGRSDVDFEIDVDAPLGAGDQDDFMADNFDTGVIDLDTHEEDLVSFNEGAAVEAFVDANDAEMLEEYDDQRVNEAEMFDGDLDEDDQMDNIDYDRPTQAIDSALAFFATPVETSGQEHIDDLTNWAAESHLDQPNTNIENTNSQEEVTVEGNLSKSKARNDAEAEDKEVYPEKITLHNTTSPNINSHDAITQGQESTPLQDNTEPVDTHPNDSEIANEDNATVPEEGPEQIDEPEEDVITYDEEDEVESLHAAQETTNEQQSSTAEILETVNNPPKRELNPDEIDADYATQQFTENDDLKDSKTIADDQKERGDEVYEEHSAGEQADEHHDSESFQEYSYDVVVEYGGAQLSLFPPSRNDLPETYLLQDHSLAQKSLAELFVACREVLGSSISDRDALEIEIPSFELYIHEDSSECSATSISQVVDVYFRLNENEGIEEPHPLTLTLKTRLRFAARLSSLFEAAEAAKGFSTLSEHNEEHHDNDDALNKQEFGETKHENAETEGLDAHDENWDTELANLDVNQHKSFIEAESLDTNEIDERLESSHATERVPKDEQNVEHADATHVESTELVNTLEDVEENPVKELEEGDLIDYLDDDEKDLEDSGRSSTIEGDSAQQESDTVHNGSNNVTEPTNTTQEETFAVAATNEKNLRDQTEVDLSAVHQNSDNSEDSATHSSGAVLQSEKDSDIPHSNEFPQEQDYDGSEEVDGEYNDDDENPVEGGLADNYDGSDEWQGEEETEAPNLVGDDPEEKSLDYSAHQVDDNGGEAEHDEFEINIGWDDEEEEHEPRNKPESPLGKRSFDEHAEGVADDEYDQEVKRIKPI